MASTDGKESVKKSNEVDESITITYSKVKNPRVKSVVFVPLHDKLSQSRKDQLMNNRTVRRPKNIDLIEEDSVEDVDSQEEIKLTSFPTERRLSMKIKLANSGIDYSNHTIEQYYNRCSVVQKTCAKGSDNTNSGTVTSNALIKKKASLNNFGLAIAEKKKKALPSDTEDTNNEQVKEKVIPVKNKNCRKNDSSTITKEGFGLKSKSKKSAHTEMHLHSVHVTPRQHSIRQGLNEENFQFQRKTVTGPSASRHF